MNLTSAALLLKPTVMESEKKEMKIEIALTISSGLTTLGAFTLASESLRLRTAGTVAFFGSTKLNGFREEEDVAVGRDCDGMGAAAGEGEGEDTGAAEEEGEGAGVGVGEGVGAGEGEGEKEEVGFVLTATPLEDDRGRE